jgi:hypothetical protein
MWVQTLSFDQPNALGNPILQLFGTSCISPADDKHHAQERRQPDTPAKMKQTTSSLLINAFNGLRISPLTALRPVLASQPLRPTTTPSTTPSSHVRLFSSTGAQQGSWLEPMIDRKLKKMKGRARVATGGSSRGTTVIWGDYGLRMSDHHRRISAKQLKVAEDTIKARLRGQKYRLYKRVACNIGVFVSGNEVSFLSTAPREIRRFGM